MTWVYIKYLINMAMPAMDQFSQRAPRWFATFGMSRDQVGLSSEADVTLRSLDEAG